MSKVISVSKAKKKISRQDKEDRASENRAKYGRSKADKKLEDAQNNNREKHLSDHKIDD